jgi:hypothetical protein
LQGCKRYKHNDFIDIFGDDITTNNVVDSPGGYIYEIKFESNNLIIIASIYVIQNEIVSKKLSKIWGGASQYACL